MENSRTPDELKKNMKLEAPSLLFGPLAQHLGSDKRRVLSPCIAYFNAKVQSFKPVNSCNHVLFNGASHQRPSRATSRRSHLTRSANDNIITLSDKYSSFF